MKSNPVRRRLRRLLPRHRCRNPHPRPLKRWRFFPQLPLLMTAQTLQICLMLLLSLVKLHLPLPMTILLLVSLMLLPAHLLLLLLPFLLAALTLMLLLLRIQCH